MLQCNCGMRCWMPCLDLLFLISSMWMFPKNIECEVHQVLLVLKCLRSYRNSKVTTKKVKTSGIWSPVGRVSQEYSSCLLICPQRLCLQLALGHYKNSFCDSMKLLAIMIYFLSVSFFFCGEDYAFQIPIFHSWLFLQHCCYWKC